MTKFDAPLVEKAKKLKKTAPIVPMHRTMDGALNGYSVIKSVFDIQHCTEGQMDALDAMHDWIATPTGLVVTLGTSALFSAVSFCSGRDEAKGKETEVVKKWGDVREALQAGRNGFKAVRGGVLTAAAVTSENLNYAVLPSSLGFGVVYMMTRLYMRRENDKKKEMLRKNQNLFAHLMNYGTFMTCQTSLDKAEETTKFKSCYVRVKSPTLKFVFYDENGKLSRNKKNEVEFEKNRYIFFKDANGKEELYYADCHGQVELIEKADIKKIKKIIKKTRSDHLSLLQLNELLPAGVARKHFKHLKQQKIDDILLSKKRLYYAIRTFNGLIDGMYLYLGVVLGVATFSPPVMLFLTMISAIYCLLCIASRVYEEYQQQHQIQIAQDKVKLADLARDLELCLIRLNRLAKKIAYEKDETKLKLLELDQKELDQNLENTLKAFEEKRHVLRSQYYLSKKETFLLGIKHGLPFYGALISFMFALAFVGTFAGFSISPGFVLFVVGFGFPILVYFVVDAFRRRLEPSVELINQDRKSAAELSKIVQDVKASFKLTYKTAHEEHHSFIKGAYAKKAFLDWIVKDLQADPLADEFYADYAEVLRSFFAGLSKGRKAVEMVLNRLQRRNDSGHYQDTFVMLIVIIPVALIYAFIFSMNAFIKGLTRKGEEKENFEHHKPDIEALESQGRQLGASKLSACTVKEKSNEQTALIVFSSDKGSNLAASPQIDHVDHVENPLTLPHNVLPASPIHVSQKPRPISSHAFFKVNQPKRVQLLEDKKSTSPLEVDVTKKPPLLEKEVKKMDTDVLLDEQSTDDHGDQVFSLIPPPTSPGPRLFTANKFNQLIDEERELPSPVPVNFSFNPMDMSMIAM